MKIVDLSSVLGVTAYCPDAMARDMPDEPLTAEMDFAPAASSAHHVHPYQDESYRVTSGELDVLLGTQWRTVRAGESVAIPRGTVHAFRNSTRTVTRAVNTHNPGLRFQEYLESLEELIREGKLTGITGLRNGIYMSLHSMEFRREFVAVRPPDWLIRWTARLAALLGFRLR